MTPKADVFVLKGSIMKKLAFFLSFLFITIIIFTLYFANKVALENNRFEAHIIIEKATKITEEEKDLLRSYAIALSKDETIANALSSKDRSKAIRRVKEMQASSDNSEILKDLWFQVHTKELQVFVRSWNLLSYGMNLDGFRKGIMFARENKSATVAIEAGRKLNIKAVAPIFRNDIHIGFIEVIGEYENIKQNLAKEEIDFAVYMDKELLKNAIDMQEFPMIGDFILASNKEQYTPFDQLNSKELAKLKTNRFLIKNSRVYSAQEISDYDGRIVGMMVVSKARASSILSTLNIFSSQTDDTIDIKKQDLAYNRFDNMDLKELINERQNIAKDEIIFFNQAVRKKINKNDEKLLGVLLIDESIKERKVFIK